MLMMMPFEPSLLGNRIVLMLSKLVELLQLAFPRSEPPPLTKMFRLPKQLPLATPIYKPEFSTAFQVCPELQMVDATSVRSYCDSPTADNQKILKKSIGSTT